MVENHVDPYPSNDAKFKLAKMTGLSPQQVGTWMTNMRKRHMIPVINGKRQAKNRLDHLFLSIRGIKIDSPKMNNIVAAVKSGLFFKTTRHR